MNLIRYDYYIVKKRKNKHKVVIAEFKCHCGKHFEKPLYWVAQGQIISCGCKKYRPINAKGTSFNAVILRYKIGAKQRNLEYTLSNEQVENLIKLPCHYCGIDSSNCVNHYSGYKYLHNGIDRVNNDIGYLISNVVSCCKFCNIAKRDMSYNDFIEYINRLKNYTIKEIK